MMHVRYKHGQNMRNVLALRAALAGSANSLRVWRATANAADERAAWLERRLAAATAGGSGVGADETAKGVSWKNNIVHKGAGGGAAADMVPLAEAYARHKLTPANTDHTGRLANNLNGNNKTMMMMNKSS
eukprot:1180173-Prorocentrum_minimum.AAC.2